MTCYNSELPIGPQGPTGPQGSGGGGGAGIDDILLNTSIKIRIYS